MYENSFWFLCCLCQILLVSIDWCVFTYQQKSLFNCNVDKSSWLSSHSYNCFVYILGSGIYQKSHSMTKDIYFPADKLQGLYCPTCKKYYASPSNLRVHMRIHTGERPYTCDHCKKTFNQLGSYKRHLSLIHGINKWQLV